MSDPVAEVRRRLAEVADPEQAPRVLWDGAGFREERYAAVELTGHRFYRAYQDVRTLDLYRHLVVTGAWWDYVGSRVDTRAALLAHALSRNLLGSRHLTEFFVQKAIGWALREHAKTDPEWVLAFAERHQDELAPLSRREALKKRR